MPDSGAAEANREAERKAGTLQCLMRSGLQSHLRPGDICEAEKTDYTQECGGLECRAKGDTGEGSPAQLI